MAVSPDGRLLAFAATDDSGHHLLWVRPLDSVSAQALPGTEGAAWPFWSPDSRYLGFFASGKLKKIDASGGPPETLCDATSSGRVSSGRGGTWGLDGTILFAPSVGTPLYRVSEAGGTPVAVTKLDDSHHERSHRWPYFLPDGQHFVFFARGDQTGIYAGTLGSQQTKFLVATEANAAYAPPGYLLFWREGSLMAQPFDARRLELTGKAVPIADRVVFSGGQSVSVFSVSLNGVLAVQAGEDSVNQLSWFDRTGKQLNIISGERALLASPRLSPDGRKLALTIIDPGHSHSDIWLYDLSRDVRTRFTFESTGASDPVWAPDGSQIAFAAEHQGNFKICAKSSSGTRSEVGFLEGASFKYPASWAPDGRFLAYVQRDPKSADTFQIWILPLFGDRKPFPFLGSSFTELSPAFSPDGRWIAYVSGESGTLQTYVAPFPRAETKVQVSPSGGLAPAWRADGKELFYLDSAGRLMAVDVKPVGGKLELGAPRSLFQTHAEVSGGVRPFDVSHNADRFVAATTGDVNPSPLTLIVNWTAELKKK